MPSDRNNPLTNRLAFNGLNIFWRDECAVAALVLFLVGFIVSRQSVSSVKLCHISKHIAVVFDEIIIAAFISSAINGISQNQPCCRCVKMLHRTECEILPHSSALQWSGYCEWFEKFHTNAEPYIFLLADFLSSCRLICPYRFQFVTRRTVNPIGVLPPSYRPSFASSIILSTILSIRVSLSNSAMTANI